MTHFIQDFLGLLGLLHGTHFWDNDLEIFKINIEDFIGLLLETNF